MKILFLKLSSLPFFLYVVCFVFKTTMILYITQEQRIWQVVWVQWIVMEKLHFILFVILQRYFIKSYAKKYNLKYMMNVW